MKTISFLMLGYLLIFEVKSNEDSEPISSDRFEPYEIREARFKEKLNQVEESEWLTEIVFNTTDAHRRSN